MPEEAFLYGLPYEYYEKYKVRRYGFHGTSHAYVSRRAAELYQAKVDSSKSIADLKTIVCHLGNGASVSAVKYGKSVDTSMGLTPLEGLIMGTRSGDIDPAIIEFIALKENKTLAEVTDILNKKSGLVGLQKGGSSDFRDITAAINDGKVEASRAVKTYIYHIAKYVGAYTAAMNGVDLLCFTAGIGENIGYIRAGVCEYLGYLGLVFDDQANELRGEEIVISKPESKVCVMVVPTNEDLMIARDTRAIVMGEEKK
jgi:acetate kinase